MMRQAHCLAHYNCKKLVLDRHLKWSVFGTVTSGSAHSTGEFALRGALQ